MHVSLLSYLVTCPFSRRQCVEGEREEEERVVDGLEAYVFPREAPKHGGEKLTFAHRGQ